MDNPMLRVLIRTALFPAMLLLGACSRAPKPPAISEQQYPLKGTVLSVNAANARLRVKHDEIPGFMEAMTMEFEATTSAELANIKPGDTITGKLRVTENQTKLSEIQKTGHAAVPTEPASPNTPKLGTQLPDATLTDDSGAALRLSDYRGKTLAITFIYTRCPLPDFCPLMNSNFATAARDLTDARCHWLSLTIDPTNDTPQLLAEYAKQFPSRDTRWKFATGSIEEVTKLAKFAGLEIRTAGTQIDHNLRTLIVGPDGKLTKVLTGNQWKPEELAEEMRRTLR